MQIRFDHGFKPEGTQYLIAKLLDMTPNGHLHSILADMVAERRLNVRKEQHREGVDKWIYVLPDPHLTRKNERQEPKIKVRGIEIKQEKLL